MYLTNRLKPGYEAGQQFEHVETGTIYEIVHIERHESYVYRNRILTCYSYELTSPNNPSLELYECELDDEISYMRLVEV